MNMPAHSNLLHLMYRKYLPASLFLGFSPAIFKVSICSLKTYVSGIMEQKALPQTPEENSSLKPIFVGAGCSILVLR